MNDINFGHLGSNYQLSLLKLIIEDRKFSETIIEVIEPDYFDNSGMKFIVQNIKEYFETYGKTVPQYNAIEEQIKAESISDTNRKSNLDMLSNVKNHVIELGSVPGTKDRAIKFCKQQVVKKAIKKIEEITKKGDFEQYNTIEKIIQDALQVGVMGH